jgi:hypothetical protein
MNYTRSAEATEIETRERKARELIKLWRENRTVAGVVTLERATALNPTRIKVAVDGYIVIFHLKGNRTYWYAECPTEEQS